MIFETVPQDATIDSLEQLLRGYLGEKVSQAKERFKYGDGAPLSMGKLSQSAYAHRADIVARSMLGRDLVLQAPSGRLIRATLREIAAYQGIARTTSKEINHEPGIISISHKMRQYLIDICTKQGKEPSCITLRAADIHWPGGNVEPVHGPGNLAKRLGITRQTEPLYHCQTVYGSKIWIEGDSIAPSEIREKEGNASNCLGIFYF